MTTIEPTRPAPIAIANDLAVKDLRAALGAGWRDFAARPGYGLFFGAIFAVSGLVLGYLLLARGEPEWLIPAAAGFPLLAPFTAVGLYEVSRRREANLPTSWSVILGAGGVRRSAGPARLRRVHGRSRSGRGIAGLSDDTRGPDDARRRKRVRRPDRARFLFDHRRQPADAGRSQGRFPDGDHHQPAGIQDASRGPAGVGRLQPRCL